MPPELALPEKAIDRYEVRWWTISVGFGILEHRATYHVNTPWALAEHTGFRGVDFVDQWQLFTSNRFIGRSNNGWEVILDYVPDEPITDLEEAKYQYRTMLRRRIRQLKAELGEQQTKLREAS